MAHPPALSMKPGPNALGPVIFSLRTFNYVTILSGHEMAL